VDAIREACSFLGETSSLGAGRALIIAGAETMNHQAANALLKRLEEPPAGSLLILTTSALGALPITVRSRCWRVRLRGLDEATFTTCLPSAGPDSYALHSGNLDAAMEEKPNPLTQALHQRYTILMDKAKRHDPSVLVDLEGYDKITALMRDVPQYHLDADAAAVLAEQGVP
jgi:DNA polymerase III delta prime subunit